MRASIEGTIAVGLALLAAFLAYYIVGLRQGLLERRESIVQILGRDASVSEIEKERAAVVQEIHSTMLKRESQDLSVRQKNESPSLDVTSQPAFTDAFNVSQGFAQRASLGKSLAKFVDPLIASTIDQSFVRFSLGIVSTGEENNAFPAAEELDELLRQNDDEFRSQLGPNSANIEQLIRVQMPKINLQTKLQNIFASQQLPLSKVQSEALLSIIDETSHEVQPPSVSSWRSAEIASRTANAVAELSNDTIEKAHALLSKEQILVLRQIYARQRAIRDLLAIAPPVQ